MKLKVNKKNIKGYKNVNEKWIPTISSGSRDLLNLEGVLGSYW